jgi:hypothetical protein
MDPTKSPHSSKELAPVAQLAEQWTFNPRVVGSNPTGCTGRSGSPSPTWGGGKPQPGSGQGSCNAVLHRLRWGLPGRVPMPRSVAGNASDGTPCRQGRSGRIRCSGATEPSRREAWATRYARRTSAFRESHRRVVFSAVAQEMSWSRSGSKASSAAPLGVKVAKFSKSVAKGNTTWARTSAICSSPALAVSDPSSQLLPGARIRRYRPCSPDSAHRIPHGAGWTRSSGSDVLLIPVMAPSRKHQESGIP